MPIDAERWLASRGVPRERIVGSSMPADGPAPAVEPGPRAPGVRETLALAAQSAQDADLVDPARGVDRAPSDGGPEDGSDGGHDGTDETTTTRADDVDAALAFVRRSTANAPQSEGRLRAKLMDRGHDGATAEQALERARAERLVDDDAILVALITERRARGHADPRLRRDLRDRGFTGPQVDEALARVGSTDPAAAAFAVARDQAARHRGVDPEVAVRRTVGALVRRGHGEALARKAARDAVYADREAQQVAGR